SSIVFDYNDDDSLCAYSKLDQLVQEKNVCFVSATGNIPYASIIGGKYPAYIHNFPVLFPAQNTNSIAVGSITRKYKVGAIAPIDSLSPFTRCGKSLPKLYDSIKHDLVE